MSRPSREGAARRFSLVTLGAAALAAFFTAGFFAQSVSGPVARAGGFEPVHASAAAVPAARVAGYADLVAQVAPSIVTVRSERMVRPAGLPFGGDDDALQRFFGRGFGVPPRELEPRRQGGLGSGVIASADGYVLTNHHVVADAETVKVDLADRRTFSARVVGTDAASDLAVLRIDAQGLPALPFGDSDKIRVGDVVLAFGNPLGIGQTVTMGIVSAKGRATGLGDGNFEDFLQTDAPINQGNSGGALVDTAGRLVGINSQIVSPSGGNIGIGFAIPVRMAENVMTQLVNGGKVHRGQLGVTVQGVTSEMAESLGLPKVEGALVSSVAKGSPAERAGVERGDVITRLDGEPVGDGNSLRNRIAGTAPGKAVELGLVRDGSQKTLRVQLGELESARSDDEKGEPVEGGRLGLTLQPLTPEDARRLGLDATQGLLVAEVDPAGPAAAAGFQPGDVIQEVNRRPVASAAELKAAVKAAGRRPALVFVSRKGGSVYLTLEPPRA